MDLQTDIALIESTLAYFRPLIQGDGGDISLMKYENGIVYVKLFGACVSCPASLYTLKLGIEETLREKIPTLREVIAVDE